MKKTYFVILFSIAIIIYFISYHVASSVLSTTAIVYKEYKNIKYPFNLKLPETTKITESSLDDYEILFSSFISDERLKFWGFIQMWNVLDLDKFIKDSKTFSTFNFISYNQQKIKIKLFEGYRVDWTAKFQNDKTYSGQEYFIKRNNSEEILRISFMVEKNCFSKELNEIINTIIQSIEWN